MISFPDHLIWFEIFFFKSMWIGSDVATIWYQPVSKVSFPTVSIWTDLKLHNSDLRAKRYPRTCIWVQINMFSSSIFMIEGLFLYYRKPNFPFANTSSIYKERYTDLGEYLQEPSGFNLKLLAFLLCAYQWSIVQHNNQIDHN